jgi:hypothetical protein
MTAEPGGVWKATITVMPKHVEPISAEVVLIETDEPLIIDDQLLEVTAVGDCVRRLVKSVE